MNPAVAEAEIKMTAVELPGLSTILPFSLVQLRREPCLPRLPLIISGAGQKKALLASPTANNFSLADFYLPSPFDLIIPNPLLLFSLS